MAVEINVRSPAWRRFHALVEERDRQRIAEARRQAARGWLGWLWGAAAERKARREHQLQQEAGLKGERQVGAVLRLLPDDWFVLNGLVVEVREGEYQEIDHVAVGPSGLVVVETKAWGGVLEGGVNGWRRWRQGQGWRPIELENPLEQLSRHVRIVGSLLEVAGFKVPGIWAVLAFPIAQSVRYQPSEGGPNPIVRTGAQLGGTLMQIAGLQRHWPVETAMAAALVLTVQRPALRVVGEAVWSVGEKTPRGIVRVPAGAPATDGQRQMILRLLAERQLTAFRTELLTLSRREASEAIDRIKAGELEGLPLQLTSLDEQIEIRVRQTNALRLTYRMRSGDAPVLEWVAAVEGLPGCEVAASTPEEAVARVGTAKRAWWRHQIISQGC